MNQSLVSKLVGYGLAALAGLFGGHVADKLMNPKTPDLPECAGQWRQAGFAGFVKGDTVQFSPMFECVVPEVQQGPKGQRNGLSIL